MIKCLIIIGFLATVCQGIDIQNLQVVDLNQDTLALKQIINPQQPTFIYLWATWCHVCRKELPKMVTFFQEESDINILPIAYPNTTDQVNSFLSEQEYSLNTFIDYTGQIFKEFDAKATPTVVILDPNKQMVFQGYKSIRSYKKILKKLKEK